MGSTGRQEQEGEDERGEKGGNGEKRKRKKVYVCGGGGVHITHLCGLSSVLPFGSFLPDTPRPIQMIQKW